MHAKIVIKCSIFLAVLLTSFSISYAELYSGGPWRGRVIDADTKEPIEGAVVVAIWKREYDTPAGGSSRFHDAKETLTDEGGRFEIPAYRVSGDNKSLWREKDLQGNIALNLFIPGPTISGPDFIIYKPSYGNYPRQDELGIYPIEDGSKVEYQEFHKEIVKGQEIEWVKKRTKTFPEGLAYVGKRCKSKIDAMAKALPFGFGSFFISMERAKDMIERLEIPLDCPDNGEPIPDSMHGFRDDTIDPLHSNKGGFTIIELPKLKTREERKKAHWVSPPSEARKLLPILHRLLDDEYNYLFPNNSRSR